MKKIGIINSGVGVTPYVLGAYSANKAYKKQNKNGTKKQRMVTAGLGALGGMGGSLVGGSLAFLLTPRKSRLLRMATIPAGVLAGACFTGKNVGEIRGAIDRNRRMKKQKSVKEHNKTADIASRPYMRGDGGDGGTGGMTGVLMDPKIPLMIGAGSSLGAYSRNVPLAGATGKMVAGLAGVPAGLIGGVAGGRLGAKGKAILSKSKNRHLRSAAGVLPIAGSLVGAAGGGQVTGWGLGKVVQGLRSARRRLAYDGEKIADAAARGHTNYERDEEGHRAFIDHANDLLKDKRLRFARLEWH